jgi:RHS repeat-associated protein
MEYSNNQFKMYLSDSDTIEFGRLDNLTGDDTEDTVYVPKRLSGINKGIILNWDSDRKLLSICNDASASATQRTAVVGLSSDISLSYALIDRIVISGYDHEVTLYKSGSVLDRVENRGLRIFKYEYGSNQFLTLEKVITPNPGIKSGWDINNSSHWITSEIKYSDDKTRIDSIDSGLDSKMEINYGTQQSDVTSKVDRDQQILTSQINYSLDFSGIERGYKVTGPNLSHLSSSKTFTSQGDLFSLRTDGMLLQSDYRYTHNPSQSNIRNLNIVGTPEGNLIVKNISYPSGYSFGRLDSVRVNDLPEVRYKYNTDKLVQFKLTPKPGIIRGYPAGNELLDNNFTVSRNASGFVVQRSNGTTVSSYIVTEYEYNSDKNIMKIYALKPDGVLGVTELEYSNSSYRDNVTKIIYPDGKKTTYEYDLKGRVVDAAQSKNNVIATTAINHTNYYYDAFGRIDHVLMPPTNITGTFANTSYTDETGRALIKYEYNGNSDQVLTETVYNEADHTVNNWVKQKTYTYRKDGSVSESASFEKNSDGSLNKLYVKISDIIPIQNTNDYSIITLMHSEGTANGEYSKAQCVVYDNDGNVKVTYISNNPAGLDITTCKFPNNITNSYNFVKRNEILYTNLGAPREVIDKNNRHITYSYDARYRIDSIKKFATGGTVSQLESKYYYNDNNTLSCKMEKMIDGNWFNENYNYDWNGNILNRSMLFTEQLIYATANIGYGYDAVGNRNKVILPNGNEIISSYDQSGNLSNISSPYGNMKYYYNNDSTMLGYLRGKSDNTWNLKTKFDYDDVDKLIGITNIGQPDTNHLDDDFLGSVNPPIDLSGKVKSIFNSFIYDSQGRLKSYIAQVDKSNLTVQNWQVTRHIAFNYNSRGQLINETHRNDNIFGTIWSQMEYKYDDITTTTSTTTGVNLTGINRQLPGQTQITNATPLLTFDVNNRIINNTDFYFDDNTGNPTKYAGKTMTYDVDDRLINVKNSDDYTILDCSYYADGKRAWKCGSSTDWTKTYFIYDGDQLLCEMKYGDNFCYYPTAINLWGADGLAGRVEKISAGTDAEDLSLQNPTTLLDNYYITWYAYDQQGTVAQRFAADGTLINVYACDAFGNKLAGTEEVYNYNAKSGYYYDAETGFYYCTHRYYDPANGRWLTEDPIGFEGGLNLYGYCGNSPVGSVDWSGLVEYYSIKVVRFKINIENQTIYDDGLLANTNFQEFKIASISNAIIADEIAKQGSGKAKDVTLTFPIVEGRITEKQAILRRQSRKDILVLDKTAGGAQAKAYAIEAKAFPNGNHYLDMETDILTARLVIPHWHTNIGNIKMGGHSFFAVNNKDNWKKLKSAQAFQHVFNTSNEFTIPERSSLSPSPLINPDPNDPYTGRLIVKGSNGFPTLNVITLIPCPFSIYGMPSQIPSSGGGIRAPVRVPVRVPLELLW